MTIPVDSTYSTREKDVRTKIAEERQNQADLTAGLQEYAALVSRNLKHMCFENKQKLLRLVLDKVVVKDWRVDVYYKIPLPRPDPPTGGKVSSKLDLRSASTFMPSTA